MSLREELQAIYEERGRLTPAVVLDTARDPDHPLHSRFEWDDGVAGEAYRRLQARELIRSVRVTYRPANGEDADRSVRAFHAVRDPEGVAYEPAEKIANDPLMAKILLADMEREWRSLRERYERFGEFWQIVRGDLEAKAS